MSVCVWRFVCVKIFFFWRLKTKMVAFSLHSSDKSSVMDQNARVDFGAPSSHFPAVFHAVFITPLRALGPAEGWNFHLFSFICLFFIWEVAGQKFSIY